MAEGDRSGRLQSCGKIHLDRHMINKSPQGEHIISVQAAKFIKPRQYNPG